MLGLNTRTSSHYDAGSTRALKLEIQILRAQNEQANERIEELASRNTELSALCGTVTAQMVDLEINYLNLEESARLVWRASEPQRRLYVSRVLVNGVVPCSLCLHVFHMAGMHHQDADPPWNSVAKSKPEKDVNNVSSAFGLAPPAFGVYNLVRSSCLNLGKVTRNAMLM